MPLFDYICQDCGGISEILVTGSLKKPVCNHCNSSKLKKLMSAHSSMSGPSRGRLPGYSDTACCPAHPGESAGCAGPGSCCGKA